MGLEDGWLYHELKPRNEEEYQPDEREGGPQPEETEPSPESEEAAREIARKDLC